MTAGAPPSPSNHPPPSAQHQTASPHHASAQASTSPPSKRDLKSWWKGFKLAPRHQEQNDVRSQGIFGVPLRQSITYANVAISLVDESGKSYIYGYVPIVVAKCGVFLKEKATEVEGIFRLSGSEKRIKDLKTIFDSPERYGKGLVWDGYTVHDAANVLRRYLNDLPEPVVPLDLYEQFRQPLKGATKKAVGDADGPQLVDNFDEQAAIAKYQALIKELPPLNRQLLLYILDLLAVFAAKSDVNRMNSQNLAAIFQPGMLSHPNHAMAPDEYRLNQCVLIFLIENQDHFLIGMQGTAADEKTVREVQKGTPPTIVTPSTPIPSRKSGVTRSSSNASAGAESVAKEGKIRRNKSTSSRRSRHSNGAPSPSSPAVTSTPTSGLGRSNTVPSKKSPALQSANGRFAGRGDASSTPIAPLTPVTPSFAGTSSVPPVVEELATPDAAAASPTPRVISGKHQDGLLEPVLDANAARRDLHSILTGPLLSSDGDRGERRMPNKLRKKKIPGGASPSAQSSTTSLPHPTGVSPGAEKNNPMEIPEEPALTASTTASGPSVASVTPSIPAAMTAPSAASGPIQAAATVTAPKVVPPAAQPAPSADVPSYARPSESTPPATISVPAESTPRASQIPSGSAFLPPETAEHSLETSRSIPVSMNSSFNEGSDFEPMDDLAPPAEIQEGEREKKERKRWLSRKKEDTGPTSTPGGVTSPRKVLGMANNSEASTSSMGSSGHRTTRRSFAGESADPALMNADVTFNDILGRDGKDGKDESRGLSGWLKTKYREAKENHDQKRNKSPPADRGAYSSVGTLPMRGASLDIKRSGEEAKAHGASAPNSDKP